MNASLSQRRAATLAALAQQPLDVLIVGGGIVGAGIARDAAMRGLQTGLVEQRDFAFGASSRTSRLLHGGLRYLAQGRVGLVRQASIEKAILHRIAPHLAQPLQFTFPAYRGTDWPLWQMRLGVKVYDLLCGGRNLGASTALSKAQVMRALPELNDGGLTGGVAYFDALTNDARLVLDTLRSAAKYGARLLNYCEFRNASAEKGIWRCQVEDKLAGRGHDLPARVVVNAAGPWAQGLPRSRVHLRMTKGVHLVLSRKRLAVPNAVVLTEGKRILFVIPWGARAIAGTTDTDFLGTPGEARVESADVDYLLRVVNQFFPRLGLVQSDVLSAWAGVRPLIADARGGASDISRAHQIRNPEPNWWDVAGGKLTTYRLMAEQAVDRIIRETGLRGARCRTAIEPLLERGDIVGISGILPPEFGRELVEHFCANEWVLHLDDVMIRRAGWHYYDADAGLKAERVAAWMADSLGWSTRERDQELARYQALQRI
jgi:glycerol-3-phosphate dehydrogenase